MNLETVPKEPMLAIAQRLLKLPQQFSHEELDQLELLYLWYLIGSYAKRHVVFYRHTTYEETTHGGWRKRVDEGIRGFNDTQLAALVDLFGRPRGKYFNIQTMHDISMILVLFGIRSEYS
jgi:hypothetical protein